MRRFLASIDVTSEWSGKAVSILILSAMIILLGEITGRYVFHSPSIWAHETSQHIFGAYSVLAGAYVLLHFEHIRVDIVYARLSPRGQAITNSITYLLFFLAMGLLLKYSLQMAWHSVAIKELCHSPWASPAYPVKCTIPLAAVLMILQGIAHYIRFMHMAITGRELV